MKDQKITLTGQDRTVLGKAVRRLRAEGNAPANVYGPDIKSRSVTVNLKDFKKVYKVAEETGIVYLKVDKDELPVLIKNVQLHPLSHSVLHVDFRKINLQQKIETQVPINVAGVAPAVAQKGGVLLTQTDEVTIESLPQDIPHEISVDVSSLNEIGDEIKIANLTKDPKYEIKDDPEKIVVQVIAHKEESLVAETAPAAEPEIIEEKPAEEGVEAEAGAEAAAAPPAEGKPQKDKPSSAKAPEGKEEQKAAEGQKPAAAAKAPEGKQEPQKEAKKEEKK